MPHPAPAHKSVADRAACTGTSRTKSSPNLRRVACPWCSPWRASAPARPPARDRPSSQCHVLLTIACIEYGFRTQNPLTFRQALEAGGHARKLQEATFGWSKVSAAISEREARQPKLLLDSLDSKLRRGAPAAEVNSTIYIVLEELGEDIAAELR